MLVRLFQSAQYTNHHAQEFKLVLETESESINPALDPRKEGGVRTLLAYLFQNCNGEGQNKNLAHAWYFNGFGTSMSVGDVIEIEYVMYQIAPVGYSELMYQEMVQQPNGSYRIVRKSDEDASLESLRRKLMAYPVVNVPQNVPVPSVNGEQLSRLQQVKELRNIALRLSDTGEEFANAKPIMTEGVTTPGTHFRINNPARNLRFWNELTKELERNGFTIVRKQ